MTTPPATQSRQMSTPNFKSLLEQVTPGPWGADFDDLGIWISPSNLPVSVAKICTKWNGPHQANALYIARLNPAVMKVVVEALELAANGDTSQTCSPGNESIVVAAMDALKALNAQP